MLQEDSLRPAGRTQHGDMQSKPELEDAQAVKEEDDLAELLQGESSSLFQPAEA